MSFESLLISQATIWDITQTTALGITETTVVSETVDCRINAKRSIEGLTDQRETNVGSHVVFLEPTVSIDITNQLVSNGNIYHVRNVREIYGRKGLHHYEVDVDEIE